LKSPDDKYQDADRKRRHATQQKLNHGTKAGNTTVNLILKELAKLKVFTN